MDLECSNHASIIALQGLTLDERLLLPSLSERTPKTCDQNSLPHLKIWRSWFDHGQPTQTAWKEFLADYGLSEKKLIRLACLSRAPKRLPSWTATLRHLRDYLASENVTPNASISVGENLAVPAVKSAWDALVASRNGSNSRLLSARAVRALQYSLLQRLNRTANQVANWETLAAKSERSLVPRAGPRLDDNFFSNGVTKETIELLNNYPALGRLWTVQIEAWARSVVDFLRHANVFAQDNGLRNAGGRSVISFIETDLSDPHEGNRTVMRVSFGEGRDWFYKPRSGLHEREWFSLLRWINDKGFARPFKILDVRCKDRHCWMESVRSQRPRNQDEKRAFHFRLGALVCLIHFLRGVDFHPANVIGAGDQPVVIDCETLIHPATTLPECVRAEDSSIRRTGMLALLKFCLANSGDQRLVEDLIDGFHAMHRFVAQNNLVRRHLKQWGERLRRVPVRIIYRPTVHYSAMLKASLLASLMTSGLDRSLYLHAACRRGVSSTRRIRAEIHALENADIPVFRGKGCRVYPDVSDETLQKSISTIRAASNAARSSR